jgi:hypothetical protein
MSKTHRLVPDTAYRLLNPVSQKKQSASQGYLPRAYVPGGSSPAVAGAIQRAGSPKNKPSHAAGRRGGAPNQTTSPVTSQGPPPAPPGWIIGGPCSDLGCSGSATYLIPLLPQPSTPPLAASEPPVDNPVGSGTWEIRGQTNVPQ